MFPDESWLRRFDKAGRYDYQCGPHPEMKGSIVVAE
jgi:plastocyanin